MVHVVAGTEGRRREIVRDSQVTSSQLGCVGVFGPRAEIFADKIRAGRVTTSKDGPLGHRMDV